MNEKVANYMRAGTSGIYLVTHEEARAEADMAATAKGLGFSFYVWSVTEGLAHVVDAVPQPLEGTEDPIAMLDAFTKLPERSMVLARDFHAWLPAAPAGTDNGSLAAVNENPGLVRKVRDALAIGRASQRTLVICGCQLRIPAEIEKEVMVVDFKLPTRDELVDVLNSVAESAGVQLDYDEIDPLLDAASGLTSTEAADAFALSYAMHREFRPEVIQEEKAATVRKNGLLEIVPATIGLESIGGLSLLKQDLHEKRNLFTKSARDYGLPTPRGMLVVGQPGTGKSLSATATARIFNLPLIRLEAGRLFGSLVGQSEANWRKAFATARAIAPCVFWIDEVDGLFGTAGEQNGGTTQRLIKNILQDMQMNGEGVFFYFTANDIDRLPDPLIDRLDVWSVDLPDATEREQVWQIHIAKRNRKPDQFKMAELSRITDGFSGRQIEQVWLKAMTLAFNDDQREATMKDCTDAASRVVATSKTMAVQIEARRQRLAGRASPASKTVVQSITTTAGKEGEVVVRKRKMS
jgi:AAA+ superfamily predicted ATPase